MWEKNTLNEVKLSTKYFSFPLSFVLLPVYLTDVPSLSFLLGFLARPKAIPVQDTVYCDITLLCYCLGSTVMKIAPNQKDWCTRHFSHAYCCLAAVAGEHWFAMGVHSSEQVFHISLFFFHFCCCCCCKFAFAPATPSLWRSLDLDFAALVMSHSNILTHPSILVRGLVKQQKDRKLLVEIPKWRYKCWKTSSAFICPQLRQRSCAASINISAS